MRARGVFVFILHPFPREVAENAFASQAKICLLGTLGRCRRAPNFLCRGVRWNRALGKNLNPTRAVTSGDGAIFSRARCIGVNNYARPWVPIGLFLKIKKSHPTPRARVALRAGYAVQA